MHIRPTIRLIPGLGLLLLVLIMVLIMVLLSPQLAAEAAYRWQDSEGGLHYADKGPPAGTVAEQITLASDSGFYRVAKVYDGDTVQLEGGMRVRLLGINTPEVAHRNRPADPGGEAAGTFLRELVGGRLVRLEYGPERHDKYQRVLAHLYSETGENINERMLREGYAHAVVKLPNISHIEPYFSAEKEARMERRGIWQLAQFEVAAIEQAGAYRNTFRRLKGVVKRAEEKNSAWLLHFRGGVIALIRKEHLAPFVREGIRPRQLAGRELIIRGWVHQGQGVPLIRLYHPRMIEHVGDAG